MPVNDLEALTSNYADVIFEIAVKSGRMQGTLIKGAKEAAASMCAAATALAIKAQNPKEIPIDEQIDNLRQSIDDLKHKNNNLEHINRNLKKSLDAHRRKKPAEDPRETR